MRRVSAVDTEDALSAFGEVIGRRASHRTQAHDDDVERFAHGSSCPSPVFAALNFASAKAD